MKYPVDVYLNAGFCLGDEDINGYKDKLVKCRKWHRCSHCQGGIKAGEHALLETGFMDGYPISSYTCIECIEGWLEESGQTEGLN